MGLENFITETKTKSSTSKRTRQTKESQKTNKAKSLIEKLGHEKYIEIIMLFRDRDKDGNYMGPQPPSKFQEGYLPEEDWDDRWIDATGEFQYKDDKPIKYLDCKNCGAERIWTGHRSRYVRCRDCGAVHMDKHWRDDRVENKHMKTSVDDWQ